MAHKFSVIAIKGNDLKKVETAFKAFRYFDLESDKSFPVIDEALFYLGKNFEKLMEEDDVVLRGVWADTAYTYLYDPEMVDATDEDALEELAKKINTAVYVFIIDEAAAAYEFASYSPKGQQRYFSLEGKDLFNDGEPLPEEQGLNMNGQTKAADLLQLAANLDIDLEFKHTPEPFLVKELGYNEDL